jgi:transposase
MTIPMLAARFGVAKATVHNWLVAAGIPRRPSAASPRSDISDQEIRELYVARRLSAADVAASLGCSSSAVYHRLKRLGITRRRRSRRNARRPRDDELRRLYEDHGLSLRTIAKRYQVSPQAVQGWLITAKVARRHPGASGPSLNIATLASEYENGRTGPELAAQFGCSTATVYRRLEAFGTSRRDTRSVLDRETLTEALASGCTAPEIAATAGVSVSAACRALAREQLLTESQTARREAAIGYGRLLRKAEDAARRTSTPSLAASASLLGGTTVEQGPAVS